MLAHREAAKMSKLMSMFEDKSILQLKQPGRFCLNNVPILCKFSVFRYFIFSIILYLFQK